MTKAQSLLEQHFLSVYQVFHLKHLHLNQTKLLPYLQMVESESMNY